MGSEKDESKRNDDYDEEEPLDIVSSLHGVKLQSKIKTQSDITGMGLHTKPLPRRRIKAVSDISDLVLDKRLPVESKRRRQVSSSDVITKFGQAPVLRFDDLNLADQVAAYGTVNERKTSISEAEFEDLLKGDEVEEFAYNFEGLTAEEAAKRLELYGRNELPEHVDPKWLIFLRQFWAPMPIMIWIAVIIEAGIQNFIDMGILLLIQFANGSISFYETTKAGDAVAALKSSLKPSATCKRDGKWQVIDGTLLVPGDTVLLGSGSAIPADCRVNHSEIDVDQAALTGESLPVTFYKGDSCKMGSTVVRGEVEVSFFVNESTFSPHELVRAHYSCYLFFYRQRLSLLEPRRFSAKPPACSKSITSIVTCRKFS
jgi:H+-transporting ATPase